MPEINESQLVGLTAKQAVLSLIRAANGQIPGETISQAVGSMIEEWANNWRRQDLEVSRLTKILQDLKSGEVPLSRLQVSDDGVKVNDPRPSSKPKTSRSSVPEGKRQRQRKQKQEGQEGKSSEPEIQEQINGHKPSVPEGNDNQTSPIQFEVI